jgi:hypothetical protein
MKLKDSRAGECLWVEWSGEGFVPSRPSSIVFYTHDHVDLDIDVVKRALASALQRDGVVISLGEGYRSVESGVITYGYSGYVDEDYHLTKSNENGETYYGNQVDTTLETTWVEIGY